MLFRNEKKDHGVMILSLLKVVQAARLISDGVESAVA